MLNAILKVLSTTGFCSVVKSYASRKFLLFVLVLLSFVSGWFYALGYKESVLNEITWAIIVVLGMYAGTNITSKALPEYLNKGSKNKEKSK